MSQSSTFVWFRNDLRIADNPALYHACADKRGAVMAVAAITPQQWHRQDEAKSRVQFWLASLSSLQAQLAALNIPLLLLQVQSNDELPQALAMLAQQHRASALYFNREYPDYEQRRDRAVSAVLSAVGVTSRGYDSDVILPPGSIVNQQGLPYKVFTPFARAWRYRYTLSMPQPLPAPDAQAPLSVQSDPIPSDIAYPLQSGANWCASRWPAGTEAAHRLLQQFIYERVADYTGERDVPARSATSSLSPYLSVGVLSARQCVAALQINAQGDEWLDSQWLTELVWREFYRHLLVAFPAMNRWQPFKPEVQARIVWKPDTDLFEAWCAGQTGFSIVDAGMQQLLQTGWMHNRLRMVTASFLTKLLRQHWQQGAQFFMRHLIDGDFASNLGGWQWSASVGADAAPYFRIFNPMRQAQRFDPQGDYVATWLPELCALEGMQRHDSLFAVSQGRPPPIIDYGLARQQSLDDYNAG